MNRTSWSKTEAFSVRRRLLIAAAGIAFLVPLVLARHLDPNPRGEGTHRQLGLPPCTFHALTGRPCPSCGATTAWAYLVRGRMASALSANAAGTVLGFVVALVGPWLVLSAAFGRWLGGPPTDTMAAWLAIAVVVLSLVQWGFRLVTG